jgi:CHAD domain-containing protein
MSKKEPPAAALNVHSQALSRPCAVQAVAAKVLSESLLQFTGHLTALRGSDEPEVVHQARVAWRRFKSGLRLFRPALHEAQTEKPVLTTLQPLLQGLGALRDLDVALTETLPQWHSTYFDGDLQTCAAQHRRRRGWRKMSQALQRLAGEQRRSVRGELERPAVVATLVALTEWVDGLPEATQGVAPANVPLRPWVRKRLAVWHTRFKKAIERGRHSASPERQHRARILAKRLRYGVEALGDWLPAQCKRRWRQQAADVQASLGAARDLLQAHALAVSVAADDDILRFLRGLAEQAEDQSSCTVDRSKDLGGKAKFIFSSVSTSNSAKNKSR